MKERYFLPMVSPLFVCDDHPTCADAIIRANAGDKTQLIMAQKYINCSYGDSAKHKFSVSVHDYWCATQNVLQYQCFNFAKEIYRIEKIDLISVTKRFLSFDNYMVGFCDRACIEPEAGADAEQFFYTVCGYDDTVREFTVYGISTANEFERFQVDYQRFADAVFAVPGQMIYLHFQRYNENAMTEPDLPNIVFELDDYINSVNRRYNSDKVYGFAAIEKLVGHFRDSARQDGKLSEEYLHKFLVHKCCMKDRVAFLAQKGIVGNEWMSYAEKVEHMAEKVFEDGCLFNAERDCSLIDRIMSEINESVETEKYYLPMVLEEIKRLI